MKSPKHWEIFQLKELVDVLDNLRVPVNSSERDKRPGLVPYYGATGQVGTIDEAIFNEELVILGEDGVQFFDPNKSKAYKISGPAWVNNHAHVLRPKKEIVLQDFLLHFLNHFNYVGYANGTTRLKLTQGAMSRIPVPLPSIDEQRKIVELLEDHLSRLGAAMADVKQAKIKAAQFRRSLLQAAFSGNLGLGGTSFMTELPSEWRSVTLDEAMSECRNGLTYRNNPELAGFPVSRIETISKGEIDFEKVGYGGVTLEGNQKHLLKPGDILFSHINSMLHVGKVAIYESGMPALLHGMNLLRITPSDDFVPEFLFYLFQSSDVRKQIWSRAKHAVNQASINIGELKTVVIPKPPKDEQYKIVELLEDHLSRLEVSVSVADGIEKQSIGLRRSLLQAAFTGQLTKEVESV